MNIISSFFSPVTNVQNEQEYFIIDAAKNEALKRLELRFPRRNINESEVEMSSIQATVFSDGSIGAPKSGYMYTQAQEPGYIIEFKYQRESYHLHTTKGTYFVSNDLKSDEAYSDHALNMVMEKLTKKVNQELSCKDITVLSFQEKEGTRLSYAECKNFDEYNLQEKEIHYSFEILFEGNTHAFCFTENGDLRTLENF